MSTSQNASHSPDERHITEDPEMEIRHDSDNHRFVLYLDGVEAGFASYEPVEPASAAHPPAAIDPEALAAEAMSTRPANVTRPARDFNHTVVHPRFQGRGLSTPLIEVALDVSHAEGYAIIPTCSAIDHFMTKFPQYRSMTLAADGESS